MPPSKPDFLRLTLGPLLLMAVTPALGLLVWVVTIRHGGSVVDLVHSASVASIARELPVPSAEAVAVMIGWIAAQYLLLRLLPGPEHLGPVTPAGDRPRYRLNGIAAWWVTHGGLVVAWFSGVKIGRLYDLWGPILATVTPAAFVVCLLLYAKGRLAPSGRDVTVTGNLLFDFFQGVELHPRLLGVSLKQWINCRVSMMGWSAAALCFAAKQAELTGSVSPAMAASVALQVAYLYKFFWWEDGYFGSLDIMHDRFGYYICWGVLAWVPSVYALVDLFLVEHAPATGYAAASGIVALGLAALWINYDADAQRLTFRRSNGTAKIWGKPAESVRAPNVTWDGQRRENLLLLSGWWGVARHFHYTPELLLAFAWTLPCGFGVALPWFYLLFLTILLVDRAGRDDKRCAAKYGVVWDEYRRRVPWRIVPYLY